MIAWTTMHLDWILPNLSKCIVVHAIIPQQIVLKRGTIRVAGFATQEPFAACCCHIVVGVETWRSAECAAHFKQMLEWGAPENPLTLVWCTASFQTAASVGTKLCIKRGFKSCLGYFNSWVQLVYITKCVSRTLCWGNCRLTERYLSRSLNDPSGNVSSFTCLSRVGC